MHQSAYQDAEVFVREFLDPAAAMAIADVGSLDVNGTLAPLFDSPNWVYIGLDLTEGPNVDLVLPAEYDWSNIQSNSFEAVVSSQTVEHVRHPWRWVREVVRIVRPGGLIYLCTPNTCRYHAHPVDAWRVWPEGMRALLEDAGLQVIRAYRYGRDTTGIARKPA